MALKVSIVQHIKSNACFYFVILSVHLKVTNGPKYRWNYYQNIVMLLLGFVIVHGCSPIVHVAKNKMLTYSCRVHMLKSCNWKYNLITGYVFLHGKILLITLSQKILKNLFHLHAFDQNNNSYINKMDYTSAANSRLFENWQLIEIRPINMLY